MLCDENDAFGDKLALYRRKESRGGERLGELEEAQKALNRDICEMERRIMKIARAFEKIPAVAKIQVRDSEVCELERKLGQIEVMVGRIMEESEEIIEKHRGDSEKEEAIEAMEGCREEFRRLLKEMQEKMIGALMDIKNQIIVVQTSPD